MQIAAENYVGPERRKHPRLDLAFKNIVVNVIYFRNVKKGLGRVSFTKNISAGGVCFMADEELGENEALYIRIHIPNSSSPIQAKGIVVWRNRITVSWSPDKEHYEIGFKFDEINENDRERIVQFVDNRLPAS